MNPARESLRLDLQFISANFQLQFIHSIISKCNFFTMRQLLLSDKSINGRAKRKSHRDRNILRLSIDFRSNSPREVHGGLARQHFRSPATRGNVAALTAQTKLFLGADSQQRFFDQPTGQFRHTRIQAPLNWRERGVTLQLYHRAY